MIPSLISCSHETCGKCLIYLWKSIIMQNCLWGHEPWRRIEVPSRYKASSDLFACKVEGESMNKVIPNGSICLFRKYTGGSRNGKIVLVEHTSLQDPETGSGYTVKEYHSKKNVDDDQWSHQSITLKPLSNNEGYMDIELGDDELSGLKVVGTFECVLWGWKIKRKYLLIIIKISHSMKTKEIDDYVQDSFN